MNMNEEFEPVPIKKVIESLMDLTKSIPNEYLHIFSDITRNDLKEIQKVWGDIPVQQKIDLLTGLEMMMEADSFMLCDDIAKFALEDTDPNVRNRAISLLWECSDPEVARRFLYLLHNDTNLIVKISAASALGKFILLGELEEFSQTLYKQILNDLIELYYRDITKSLKQELIKSLGYSDRSEITSMIQESYESTEASWQLASVIAMGRSADPKKWKSQIINMIMNSDAYYPVRIEAVKAAGELEISSARPILLQMFEEEREDVEMNFHIIWALSKIGGEGVREALVRRMEITEDKDEIEILEKAIDNLDFAEQLPDLDI